MASEVSVENLEQLEKDASMNFWIMNMYVSSLVLLTGIYTEKFIHNRSSYGDHKSILRVPDGLFENSSLDIDPNADLHKNYCCYFLYMVIYFLVMAAGVISTSHYPQVMVLLQHVAIFSIVLLYLRQFTRPSVSTFIAIMFCSLWLYSAQSSFRWLLNNVIVTMCTLLTGYIKFKNFAYLQIFMWIAFVYDVYLLAGISIGKSVSKPLFSFTDDSSSVKVAGEAVSAVAVTASKTCSTLLCNLFDHNSRHELPTVFSVQFGHKKSYVYIGTGDIIIGALVSNFSIGFFKSKKPLIITNLGFTLAIALLSQVTETPFPALLSIVPLCTIGLLLAAVSSRRTIELLLGICTENLATNEPKSKQSPHLLLV